MIRMEMKTEILPASDEKSIEKAAALLQNGELVALPTETVYGIAADARNGEAVKKIFVAKGRPQDNPLIVHVTGPEMLPGLVSEVPERAQLLMAAFCPGPLTIIMPRGPEVAAGGALLHPFHQPEPEDVLPAHKVVFGRPGTRAVCSRWNTRGSGW